MTAVLAPSPPVKPRARGFIHQYSAMVAAGQGIALVATAATLRSAGVALACAVYAVTVVALFTVSATYHRHTWLTTAGRLRMRRADHSMIFVFIAGTYTPISVLALSGGTRAAVLIAVWAGTVGGVVLKMCWPTAPRWVGIPIYLAVGFIAIFVLPQLLSGGGAAVLALVLAGGLCYTLGALCYGLRRPRGVPAVFGYHEYFHSFVSLAATCQAVAIWLLVLR